MFQAIPSLGDSMTSSPPRSCTGAMERSQGAMLMSGDLTPSRGKCFKAFQLGK